MQLSPSRKKNRIKNWKEGWRHVTAILAGKTPEAASWYFLFLSHWPELGCVAVQNCKSSCCGNIVELSNLLCGEGENKYQENVYISQLVGQVL
jgi:hypothetical protein